MLIDLKEIIQKYNLNIKGVIQVGAHWAEEHQTYVDLGIENIVYIEPCEDAFRKMVNEKLGPMPITVFADGFMFAEYNGIKCFRCACGEKEDVADMYVSQNNQGQSNSLLKPNLHLQQHPEVVFNETEKVIVKPLDKLYFKRENYNLLVLDCQGYEGKILKGATETLKHIDCIYTEINTDYTYENNMLVGEMDELLSDFERVETYMPSATLTWGDAVYIRKSLL